MQAILPLTFGALLFCVGVYGVLARRNAVLVLMSVELMLAAVTVNLVAFGALAVEAGDAILTGQVFALLVIAVGAGEIGVGLAIILLLYRNRASVNIDDADLLKY
jgi:NADH:ubiquinone oxidoreductase subunit K